jgi:hypothetical protein
MKAFLATCALAMLAASAPAAGAAVVPPAPHRAADADTGYLDVSSDPPAKIFVDDADTGKTTPATHLPLKIGHHKLLLVSPDVGKKRSIGFTIEAGQTTKLSIHLAS